MPRALRPIQRPPTLRTFSAIGTGSRTYKFSNDPDVINGPGEPPGGFLIVSTSKSEWMCYWALSKIFGEPVDPRVGPFTGADGLWGYQTPLMGGRGIGGAVVDFIVWGTPSGIPVSIRIQTEFWHLFAPTRKQISDMLQRQRLSERTEVVDVYEYQFVGDVTGQAAVQVMKNACGMSELPDPLRNATARRNPRTGIRG